MSPHPRRQVTPPEVGEYSDLNQFDPVPVPKVETQCRHGTAARPMRELHGWHGDRHRDARDAIADAPGRHARDAPKHAGHDSLKLRMLLDPEARTAEHLRHRKAVEAYEARHATGHPGPQEAKQEQVPPESRDTLTSRLAKKWDSPESQQEERRRPERSWLPRADMVKAVSDSGILVTTIAVALGVASARWDAVAVGAATAVVSNVAWANRRWKEKHGHRPEDGAGD